MALQCGRCGLFCRVADEYTDFGHSGMEEPPDPVLLCAKCAQEVEDYVASIQKPKVPYIPWRPSDAHMRGLRRAGMVLAHYPATAWSVAAWPDAIPKDMVKEADDD